MFKEDCGGVKGVFTGIAWLPSHLRKYRFAISMANLVKYGLFLETTI